MLNTRVNSGVLSTENKPPKQGIWVERRLTLRETLPTLGEPPVVDGKIEKVTFSQSPLVFSA